MIDEKPVNHLPAFTPPIQIRVIAGGIEMGGRALGIERKGTSIFVRVGFPTPPGALFWPSGQGTGKASGFRIHPEDLAKIPGVSVNDDTHEMRREVVFDVVAGSKLKPMYRYWTRRAWCPIENEKAEPTMLWVACNPSIADDVDDDPTMRRFIGFSRREGFGALEVVNLFAWISTDASALALQRDPVGPLNDEHILRAARRAAKVIVAWGLPKGINMGPRAKCAPMRDRDLAVLRMLRDNGVRPWCLGRCDSKRREAPMHPLMLANDTKLEPYGWTP